MHNVTNFVVMNTTANALLALGASPVMAHAAEEVEEMAALARALVINIGTLSPAWVRVHAQSDAQRGRKQAGRLFSIPWGPAPRASAPRLAVNCLKKCRRPSCAGTPRKSALLPARPPEPKAWTARKPPTPLSTLPGLLATRYGCVVTVSGATDLIVSAGRVVRVANGHPMMPRVTGLGCTATALTGAFAAVNPSHLDAAAHAMAVMGIAGEIAAAQSPGPGTFSSAVSRRPLPSSGVGHPQQAEVGDGMRRPRDWSLYLVTDRRLAGSARSPTWSLRPSAAE